MCLAQPICSLHTTLWFLLDARNQTEILMDKAFEEKDLWKEGQYLLYMDLLKKCWEKFNENFTDEIGLPNLLKQLKEAWHLSPLSHLRPGSMDYFEMVKSVAKGKYRVDLALESVYAYFIKCCSRYDTRRFMKKIKNRPVVELLEQCMKAQDLTKNIKWVGKDKNTFTASCGRKKYVWEIQEDHLCWDMVRIY